MGKNEELSSNYGIRSSQTHHHQISFLHAHEKESENKWGEVRTNWRRKVDFCWGVKPERERAMVLLSSHVRCLPAFSTARFIFFGGVGRDCRLPRSFVNEALNV
ncbi:unnamed protein product [Cuscuta europaea]|uniref:Uncharacterized protein n=1 Tax=Cuscuta europaea TaxID=41803 RepID=A0A9P0YSC2_CUSEU|nr:unnamed protein product [Cuscuta europaea]